MFRKGALVLWLDVTVIVHDIKLLSTTLQAARRPADLGPALRPRAPQARVAAKSGPGPSGRAAERPAERRASYEAVVDAIVIFMPMP